ncbi:hypothetical protein HO173_005488 [Letharia columbiana]|uniref:Uncharacterized protein n=1 Tax=Letharia columbiana TaxID=112416 RepID=A0A8H6L5M3_9LECA|nr:uncharacterized protein HO173_005488 [Letharia columbiana]KAF6236396.1 hypothetical protein HO173_005488 [Letharia columbiana]
MAAMPISDSDLLCDPATPYHGFTFRDGYFTHQCWPGVRLIACTGDESVVIDACEAAPCRGGWGIEAYDGSRLNEEPYSLHHMLAGEALAPQFVGGRVYQANLRMWDCVKVTQKMSRPMRVKRQLDAFELYKRRGASGTTGAGILS